jgi:DNA-binding response OmpR family regulator
MLEVVLPPTVYVVDDDLVVLAFLDAVLGPAGYLVERFSGGAAVLTKAASHPPSLFVLDVRMPAVDGIELLKQLRSIEACHAIPVLMLTGSGRLDRIALAMRAGATDFLMKPFTPEQVVDKVRAMVKFVAG